MASSAPRDPAATLGAFLTGAEAKEIADRLGNGATLTSALNAVAPGRRSEVRGLLGAAGLGARDRDRTVAVLRGIQGARSTVSAARPLWTMPGHVAQVGGLTGSVAHLVAGARQSVTCSTYNFRKTSVLWDALKTAAGRREVAVRLYLDADVADNQGWSVSSSEVAAHLHPAVVLRSKTFDGQLVRHHAKFLIVDHRFVLVTSANFSWSAEQNNVEFGVLLDNTNLAESVEAEMRGAEWALYEFVTAS